MITPFDNYHETINTSAPTMWDEPELKLIPNNILLNKVLTGWGATYCEIKSPRHSIILVPNKCQIESKYANQDDTDYLFPVTEDYKIDRLIKHIRDANGRYIKFISTPEGLTKAIDAILATCGNPYTDYFILCDESHKLTLDVNYRVNITRAMDHFFCFHNKAFISATPFIPSDPRLQFFKKWKVQHERSIKKKIHLQYVNNLSSAFKEYIESYDGEMLFVFFNSLNGIHSLITKFGLQDEAKVFCSKDGIEDFNMVDFKAAYYKMDIANLGRVNFLTSSFFNGLDITLTDVMPDILILTDQNFANHTIVDPNTDVYQILGRFRQPDRESKSLDRYRNATHIVSIKHSKAVKLESAVQNDVDESRKRYHQLLAMQSTTTDEYLREQVYGEAITRVNPYYNLLNKQGDFDHFKYDNYIYGYQLKLCYCQELAIGLTYIKSGLFDFSESKKVYLPEEFETMSKGINRYSPSNIRTILEWLVQNENNQGELGATGWYLDISKRFPLIINAVNILGFDEVEQLETKSQITTALRKLEIKEGKVSQGIIDAVYQEFMVGRAYEAKDIKDKLQYIFANYELKASVKATDINTYFTTQPYYGQRPLTKKEKQSLDDPDESDKTKTVRMVKLVSRKLNQLNPHSTRTHNYNPD
ncbi:hypothetical protein [Pedobacter agri]|uniref:hypothetical protein n=1 Tax=Pedobacter agri TaxID=454586 RepID=UPI002930D933|nr:hypothetical protein [Pedobacter agri]